MKVLDLFSGLGGFSKAFEDRGHIVSTYDINPKFNPNHVMDIMNIKSLDFECPDVILASPPCECFSVASIGCHWRNGFPDEKSLKSIELIKHTLNLIYDARPKYWLMENPMGMLRTIIGNPPLTIYFAQFGENRLKPTDIWGRLPKRLKEQIVTDRSLLDYEKAPRGSKLGTQGIKSREERARIPYAFSFKICELIEKEMDYEIK